MEDTRNESKGFTLIELLVVIFIIGVLSGVFVIVANRAQKSVRDSRRIADLKSIQGALESYYAAPDNRHYPIAPLRTDLTFTPFMSAIPKDPKTQLDYTYTPLPDGCNNITTDCSSYLLEATLEADNPNDEATNDLTPTDSEHYTIGP